MPRTRSLAWSELKIGILAATALVLAILLIIAVGGQTGFFWQRYQLYTVFSDVQGLNEGALVRVAGMDAGQVTAMEFVGADIKVTLELLEEVQPLITTESRAALGASSLLGESIVTISASAQGTPLPSGSLIPSLPPPAVLSDVAGTAAESLEQLNELLAGIRAGRGTVGRLLTEDELYQEIRTLVDATEDVIRYVREGRGTLGSLIRDPSAYRNLTATLDNLQEITRTIAAGKGSLGQLINDPSFARSITAAAENLQELTASIQKGQGTLGQLATDPTLYNRLNEVAGRLETIATNLQQGEGTLGRLLEDPDLYENANAAVSEIRALVADIRKDPRKYLNVRVSVF